MNRVRSSSGGVGLLAVALLALTVACYPNPDDLRVAHGAGGSGGASGGSPGAGGRAGMSGALGGSGPPGAGGRVGAGGSGGAGTTQCGVNACGGNLVGTWKYSNTCSPTAFGDCAGETIDASGVHRVGTLTFNANGTYSTTVTDSGTFILDLATACLSGLACTDVQSAFLGQSPATVSSATCSATATGCHCLLGALGTQQTDTGTYSTSGTSVTLSSSTGGVDTDAYCVTGSILHLIYSDSTPAMPDESVLTKQ